MGAKKQPFYRVVVADVRSPRDGRFIETIGYYNPLTEPSTVVFEEEKLNRWIVNGAQPTDPVHKLLRRAGIDIEAIRKGSARAAVAPAVSPETAAQPEQAPGQDAGTHGDDPEPFVLTPQA